MLRTITLADMLERDEFNRAWNDMHSATGLVMTAPREFGSPVPFVHGTFEPVTFAVDASILPMLSAVLRYNAADDDLRARCYAMIDERQCEHGRGAHVVARAAARNAKVTRRVLFALGSLFDMTVSRRFTVPQPLCGCPWCRENAPRLSEAFDAMARAVTP